jgi:hypothetical protein
MVPMERIIPINAVIVACLLLMVSLHMPLCRTHYCKPLGTTLIESDESAFETARQAIENRIYENVGQVENSDILFYARFSLGFIGFTQEGIAFVINGKLLTMTFAETQEYTLHESEIISKNTNFFLGDRGTFTNVKGFASIVYEDLWPGISLVFRVTSSGVRHEFCLDDGAEPDDICLDWTGQDIPDSHAEFLEIPAFETSEVSSGIGFWQNSGLRYLDSTLSSAMGPSSSQQYKLSEQSEGPIRFSTYLGGNDIETNGDLVVSQTGFVYVAGGTNSPDFPVEQGFETIHQGGIDCFVVKLNSTGNGIVFSTFIGGGASDIATSIDIDSNNNVYVGGVSTSSTFPIKNAYDSWSSGFSFKGFLLKLNATGNGLEYSTFIGGGETDTVKDIAVNGAYEVIAVGSTYSDDFPIVNAFDDTWDSLTGFILKLNMTGNGLNFSTFLGGSERDRALSIALDGVGDVYVTGYTASPNFPTSNAIDDSFNGVIDCFLTKVTSSGELVYSSFIGGNSQDEGRSISIDQFGNVYLAGYTLSSDFPVTELGEGLHSTSEGFMLKVDPTGTSIIFSTLIGGIGEDLVNGVAIDADGIICITGETNSTNFPTVGMPDSTYSGGLRDSFVARVNTSSGMILFSMYIGGAGADYGYNLALDSLGDAFVIGLTTSSDFPLFNSIDDSYNGNGDCFILKIETADTDSDKMPNWWENLHGLNPNFADSHLDLDSDSISNYDEYLHGTRPDTNDSDSDQMPDAWELAHELDPRVDDANQDPDFDGLSNLEEFLHSTNPHSMDSDSDLMPDEWEVSYGLIPTLDDSGLDPDEDALNNLGEHIWGTDPFNNDSDSDLMPDGWEVAHGLNPRMNDANDDKDADGLSNLEEYQYGSDPRSADGDGDYFSDLWEVRNGFDPSDPDVPLLEFVVYYAPAIMVGMGLLVLSIIALGIIPYRRRQQLEKEELAESENLKSALSDLGPTVKESIMEPEE